MREFLPVLAALVLSSCISIQPPPSGDTPSGSYQASPTWTGDSPLPENLCRTGKLFWVQDGLADALNQSATGRGEAIQYFGRKGLVGHVVSSNFSWYPGTFVTFRLHAGSVDASLDLYSGSPSFSLYLGSNTSEAWASGKATTKAIVGNTSDMSPAEFEDLWEALVANHTEFQVGPGEGPLSTRWHMRADWRPPFNQSRIEERWATTEPGWKITLGDVPYRIFESAGWSVSFIPATFEWGFHGTTADTFAFETTELTQEGANESAGKTAIDLGVVFDPSWTFFKVEETGFFVPDPAGSGGQCKPYGQKDLRTPWPG